MGAICMLVGVVFCWTRWAIDLTLHADGIHYSETADWIIAMALAFVASFLLFRWVQKIGSGNSRVRKSWLSFFKWLESNIVWLAGGTGRMRMFIARACCVTKKMVSV